MTESIAIENAEGELSGIATGSNYLLHSMTIKGMNSIPLLVRLGNLDLTRLSMSLGCLRAVSYTHLTLPTICSV